MTTTDCFEAWINIQPYVGYRIRQAREITWYPLDTEALCEP